MDTTKKNSVNQFSKKNYMEMCEKAYEIAQRRGKQYNTEKLDPVYAQGVDGMCLHLFENGCRLFNMSRAKQKNPEKLEDDLLDAINFAVFGLLLLHDKWGK